MTREPIDLTRYPYVLPQPTAWDGAKAGFVFGFVAGLGAALILVVASVAVFS